MYVGALPTSTEMVASIMRQAKRWLLAARQDSDPRIQALHSSYAVAYLIALRETASDLDILKVTGENILGLLQEATLLQDQAAQRVGLQ